MNETTPSWQTTTRLLYVRAWGAALFLLARDFEPLYAERAKDGSGNTLFVFPPEAATELALYHATKDRLNQVAENARNVY